MLVNYLMAIRRVPTRAAHVFGGHFGQSTLTAIRTHPQAKAILIDGRVMPETTVVGDVHLKRRSTMGTSAKVHDAPPSSFSDRRILLHALHPQTCDTA
jgi:hypothetical protein